MTLTHRKRKPPEKRKEKENDESEGIVLVFSLPFLSIDLVDHPDRIQRREQEKYKKRKEEFTDPKERPKHQNTFPQPVITLGIGEYTPERGKSRRWLLCGVSLGLARVC